MSVEIPSNPTSFIVYSTNVNLDKYQETTFNISYSSNIKKLDYYLDFSLNLPYAKILVGESMQTRKKPFIDAEVNLTYAFNQRFHFTPNMCYKEKEIYGFRTKKPYITGILALLVNG